MYVLCRDHIKQHAILVSDVERCQQVSGNNKYERKGRVNICTVKDSLLLYRSLMMAEGQTEGTLTTASAASRAHPHRRSCSFPRSVG